MASLSMLSLPRSFPLASLSQNGSPSPPLPPNPNSTPLIPSTDNTVALPADARRREPRRRRRPSVMEIERAIGGGRFRDSSLKDLDEVKKTEFDMFSLNFTGNDKFEGEIMKRVRETGEWVTKETEGRFRSYGKRILLFSLQWMLPIWAMSLLVASGVVKLPFSTQFLDDLIM